MHEFSNARWKNLTSSLLFIRIFYLWAMRKDMPLKYEFRIEKSLLFQIQMLMLIIRRMLPFTNSKEWRIQEATQPWLKYDWSKK